MTRYLFDTNHVSQAFRDKSILMERVAAARGEEFGMSTATLAELWYMVHKSQRLSQNRERLLGLMNLYTHWAFDERAAEIFGRVKAELRRTGMNVADVDLQIASVALANDLVLLTADGAFGNVPGLRHENWLV
jgi:tRNA(fMet)-specific endonuclease VapC